MKKSRLAIVSTALLLAVAAGCTVPSTSSSAPVSSSTSTVDAKQEALNGAAEFLYQANKDVEVTTGDFKLPAKQFYDGVSYDVEWALNVTSGSAAHITLGEVGSDNFVPVTVVYDPVSSTEDVVYTLTATVKDGEGRTASIELNRKVPAFAFTAHADYLAAKDDTLLNVEGYIVGRYPLKSGKTSVFLQSANGEGYYVYNMAVAEDKFESDMAIGNYIIVSGAKDTYSGTAEIINATYQLSQKADVTVEPYDITSIWDAASKVTDQTLINLQGSLVTIKDVTLTTYLESNSYLNFVRGGKESYVRISSSGNCSDFDETAKETLLGNYPSKFGYKADVTGIVAQFNGNFYLMPTSKDSIKVTGTAVDAAFAVDYAKTKLTLDSTVLSDLPNTVEGTGTTITWTADVDGIFAADGKFTAPEKATEVKLTATITSGEVTDTKEFTVTAIKAEVADVATVVKAIKELASGTTGTFVLEGTVVAKDSSNRPYIMDANGNVLFVYEKLASLDVGETVKLYGVGTSYNGLYQLKNAKILEENNKKDNVNYGRPVAMTPADLTAIAGLKDGSLNGKYIKLSGLKVAAGDYINLSYDDNGTTKLVQSFGKHDFLVKANDGKEVTVYGYYNGLSSNGEAKFVAVDVKEGTIADSVDNALSINDTVLTAEGLGLAAYADGEVTIGSLGVKFFQCADYGDGIQMRTNKGKTSSFWNSTALEKGVAKVELTFNSKKHTANKDNMLIVEFSNTADFSEIGETVKVSVNTEALTSVVTPTGEYKYVRISHGNNGAVYLSEVIISSK